MKFVASADWQLGKQAHFLPEEARARYVQARLDVVRRIAAAAAQVDADFVVVAGDVFESNQLDRRILGRAFEALGDFSMPVYLLPGNHDPLDAASIYRSRQWQRSCPPHVHVLEESGVAHTQSLAEGARVDLIAAPWYSKRPGRDLVKEAVQKAVPEGGTSRPFRVVVGHGAVESLSPDADLADTVDQVYLGSKIADHDLDFVVLGDRHSTTEVSPAIWYPGTPEVTAERETDPGNVLIVEVPRPGAEAQVQVRGVGQWKLQVMPFDLADSGDVRALEAALTAVDNKETTSVKLALTGTLSVRDKVELDEMISQLGDLFARLDLWQSHTNLAVLARDTDFTDTNLAGFALDAARELQQAATADDSEDVAAADALALLLRLAEANT